MSIYIHIPFCSNICSYCDFCKVYYNSNLVSEYLKQLDKEVKNSYKGELIKTIYIGGGTPSVLNINELEILFSIINNFNLSNDYEFTFECNVESLNYEKLEFLYKKGVNRLSIGVETFNEKFLNFLNRKHSKDDVFDIVNKAKKVGFKNINIDLMYAFNEQSIDDLCKDLDYVLELDVSHISTYSLIIEPHTKLYISGVENIDDSLDYEMYRLICDKLKKYGFNHYEISNFCKEGFESKHNLVYWNNNNYYGFGCGASGYIGNVRYNNTRSINKYNSGEFLLDQEVLNINTIIENEFILGLRKISGINICSFNEKYGNIFKYNVVNKLISEGKLINDLDNIYINYDYIYISNSILVDFIGEMYE